MATVKRVISPTEWVDRQIKNLSDVGEREYKRGIASPKADPIQRGIDTEAKYAKRVKEAIDDERRKKALEKTSMAEWYKYASELGAGKLVDGVVKRKPKVTKFVTGWHPELTSHLAEIDAMAEETDKDMEERVLANLRGLKALKGKV